MKIVHIVGTGTIGEPLIKLLGRHKEELGIDEVTFHKRTPLREEKAKIEGLTKKSGARIAVDADKKKEFEALGFTNTLETKEAMERATVVIDCTPAGNENKENIYRHVIGPKLFIAQGSESGFGMPYARGINDLALKPKDKYLQIVSCNTHTASSLLRTLAYKNKGEHGNLIAGHFVFIRRANDISQDGKFIPAPTVSEHNDLKFGTHHAKDAHLLYQTIGVEPKIFSSAMKTNSQYMHIVHFSLKVENPTTKEEVINLITESPYLALTFHKSANKVFSFGRDHGIHGRILNHGVIVHDSLHISEDGKGITGWAFTPQDGNSLLSSVSAALWGLYPDSYGEKLECLRNYFFSEV